MSYTMPSKQVSSSYGPSGIVRVQVKGEKAKVQFLESSQVETGAEFVVELSDNCKGITKGQWYVQLNDSKNKMMSYRPAEGMYDVKVESFIAKKDQEPTPRINEKYGTKEFGVILEVVSSGGAKGCKIPVTLPYWFVPMEDEDGKKVCGFEQHPKSKKNEIFQDFLKATGVMEFGAIPPKDNVLPILQKRALRAEKTFKVTMKSGWVNAIYLNQDDPDVEEDEEVEE